MKILLDTNICIYLIKNRPEGIRRRLEPYAAGDVGISAVTAAELRFGVAKSQAKKRNAEALAAFFLPLECVEFDENDAIAYGDIRAALERKGLPIGPLDLFIASQAVSRNLLLITNNLREFKRVPGLKCENWA